MKILKFYELFFIMSFVFQLKCPELPKMFGLEGKLYYNSQSSDEDFEFYNSYEEGFLSSYSSSEEDKDDEDKDECSESGCPES